MRQEKSLTRSLQAQKQGQECRYKQQHSTKPLGKNVYIRLYQIIFSWLFDPHGSIAYIPPQGTKPQAWCFPQGQQVQKLRLRLPLICKTTKTCNYGTRNKTFSLMLRVCRYLFILIFQRKTYQSSKCTEKLVQTIEVLEIAWKVTYEVTLLSEETQGKTNFERRLWLNIPTLFHPSEHSKSTCLENQETIYYSDNLEYVFCT